MVYNELYENFKRAVPESEDFCNKREKLCALDRTDGMHVLFGSCVCPYAEMTMDHGSIITLKKIASFFEQMASDNNHLVAEVLEFSIIETLISKRKMLLEKWSYLFGPNTNKSIKDVERYYF